LLHLGLGISIASYTYTLAPLHSHNFHHGVSVMHLVFMVLKAEERARSFLSPIHLLSALLAGLCHDVVS
jgi:hypothetical protein